MKLGRSPSPIRMVMRISAGRVVLVSAVGALVAGAALYFSAQDGEAVPLALTLVLVALSMVEAQREAVFTDETAVSGSVVVIAAAIVGVGGDSALVPVLCAVGAALHIVHLRHREFLKILVNMGSMAGPALVASELYRAVSADREFPAIVLGILIAVSAYWLLNNALVGVAMAWVQQRAPHLFVWELVRSETAMLVFAVGGAMCGLVMVEVSRWAGIAALVALLIALDVFVISVPAGPTTLRSAWKMTVSRVAGAAVGGVVGSAIPKLVGSAVVGALLGGLIGLAAGLATVTLVALFRLRMSRTRIDGPVLIGFVVAEVALPAIGTVSGVVGAFAGLGPGIATAAGLVIAASIVTVLRRRAADVEPIDDDFLLAAVTEAMFDGLPHPANRA